MKQIRIFGIDLRKKLIGEYSGTMIPAMSGDGLITRNRTRIYESDQGNLSYVITEQISDRNGRRKRRETYVGIVSGDLESELVKGDSITLHLSPLDKPYRRLGKCECRFRYDKGFESYFLVLSWKDKSGETEFPLKKVSADGTGKRRKGP
jgi:hypothetical protein